MNTNGNNPSFEGIQFQPRIVFPDAVSSSTAGIPPTAKVIQVGTCVNGVNDWITLPLLADVANGHEITILCSAGSAFKLRTPATINQKINNVDSDGTQSYQCTDTEVVKVVKISNTIGWMAHGYSAVGAVVTAVIPA
jgi:hypothetical protein